MHLLLSVALALCAILDFIMGTGFLVDPVVSGQDFGLEALGERGSSTMRGDMTAFFYVAALSLAVGAWKRRGDALIPALGLFAIAIIGRGIDLVAQGPYAGWYVPMTVEAFHVIVILLAMRAWGWNRARA